MLKPAHAIMFFFETEFPDSMLRSPLAGVLNQISDVHWDLNAISHSKTGNIVQRTAQLIIYEDDAGKHDAAIVMLADWAKRTGIAYTVLSARELVL
jgi:hypothetical protein